MYKVYTRETPARPWLGVVVVSAALGLTLGAAWLLTNRRFAPLPLEPPLALPPAWPFSFSVPKGWSAGADDESRDLAQTQWQDELSFRGLDESGRRLRATVFYRTLPPGATARQAALRMLGERVFAERLTMSDLSDPRPSIQPLGPLYGEKLRWAGTDRRERERYALAAAACLPDGKSFGVVVDGGGDLTGDAYGALRSICSSITLHERGVPSPALTVTQMPPAGLIAPHPGSEFPSLQFTAGRDAGFAWHIVIRPTFLAPGRSIESLLHDFLVNVMELTPRPATRIAVESGRDYHAVVARPEREGDAMCVRVVDLGEGRAAFVVGQADSENADKLDAMCRRAAASLKPSGKWPFHIADATPRGEAVVAAMTKEGAAKLLLETNRRLSWIVEQWGAAIGRQQATLSPPSGDGHSYRGTGKVEQRSPGATFNLVREWSIEPDVHTFRTHEEWALNSGGRRVHASTDLRRDEGASDLNYRVRDQSNDLEVHFKAPANCPPDPILDLAVARVGREAAGDALLSVVTLSDGGLAATYVRPTATPKSGREGDTTVLIVNDYWPVPIMHQYDRRGFVRREEFEDGRVTRRVRSSEPEPARRLRAASPDEEG